MNKVNPSLIHADGKKSEVEEAQYHLKRYAETITVNSATLISNCIVDNLERIICYL